VLLTDSEIIKLHDLPRLSQIKSANTSNHKSLKQTLKQAEKDAIASALELNQDKKKVAHALDISLSTLYEKIKEYQL